MEKIIRREKEMKRMERSKHRIELELVIGFACIGATVVFGISCLMMGFAATGRLGQNSIVYQYQFATLIGQSGGAFIVTVFVSFVTSRVHGKRDR